MQLNLRLALISALALLPRISHATDGEINITGTIVANTCDITSGTGGKHAVVLPKCLDGSRNDGWPHPDRHQLDQLHPQ